MQLELVLVVVAAVVVLEQLNVHISGHCVRAQQVKDGDVEVLQQIVNTSVNTVKTI